MNRHVMVRAALAWSVAYLLGCGGNDDSSTPPADAGHEGSTDATASGEGGDGAPNPAEAGGSDAVADASTGGDTAAPDAGIPQRMLLSYNGSSQSELAAFGLASKTVDGRLTYPGFIGTTYVTASGPWLLEQANDVVARLDSQQPWVVRSSWNVALNDATDGGSPYSDPAAVVVGTGAKAYVLRYTRNEIAIIDTSNAVDGGVPIGAIDLSSQVQPNGDGFVEMSAGVYVASKGLVYVLLANINSGNVGCDGYCLICSDTHPTVVAIDVATDKLVDLNGSAPGVALSLQGYQPILGQGTMAYDAESDRLIVLESGCNVGGDGGGPLQLREIEQLSLFTGEATTLLDLNAYGFPEQLIYIDAHQAIVQLDTAYTWDPTTTALGPAIVNAPDAFAYDGAGNLLGISAEYGSDGGMSGWSVLSVRIADGQMTTLGQNPFSLPPGGFVGGVQLWPVP
jgi:hypothetical protein